MKSLIIKIVVGFGLTAALHSCSDFLEQPILGENIDTPSYYDNEENANMAVIACYNGLAYEANLSTFQWMYGDVMSDDAWKGGETAGDSDDMEFLKQWSALSTNTYLINTWKAYYTAIHRTNTVIEKMQNVTFSSSLKEQYIAEAKFIRAYSYFTLVKLYGDLPLFTKPVDVDKIGTVERIPFEEVLKQIEDDLKDAADALPLKYSSEEVGRVTSGAAQALHARVIMYEIGIFKNRPETAWQDVYDLTSSVISSGVYSLLPNYAEIFEEEGENSSESVFEIQYATTNTGYNFDNQGNASSIYVANRGTNDLPEWGWGFNCPTQSLVDEFEPNDPRLYCTVHGNGITDYVYGVKQEVAQKPHLTGYAARKLAIDPALRPSNQSDSPFNERIIRYSDVLLMKAEAAYHLSLEKEARDCVNMVRERARKSTYPKGYEANSKTYIQTGFSDNLKDITVSGADLLKAIKHERRVEFGMEALRYWDLVRWGDYRETLTEKAKVDFDKRQLRGVPVIPIPNEEVISWGLTQNPN